MKQWASESATGLRCLRTQRGESVILNRLFINPLKTLVRKDKTLILLIIVGIRLVIMVARNNYTL